MTATLQVRDTFRPAYLSLWQSGGLAGRVERALSELGDCVLCPRDCHVDRLADKLAVCRSGTRRSDLGNVSGEKPQGDEPAEFCIFKCGK